MAAIHSSHLSIFCRAGVRRVEFCPASLPHAWGQSVARSRGLPHAQLLRVGDALVLRFAFRCRHPRGPHSHVGLEGLAGGARARLRHLRWASGVAAFAPAKGPGHCDRRGPSPGRGAGDLQPLLAHHPGAGPVYRSGDLWGRRVRERLRLACTPSPVNFSPGKRRIRRSGRRR